MKDRISAYRIVVALLAGVYALAWALGEHLNAERHEAQVRAEVQNRLTLVRDQLAANLNGDIQLVTGLVGVVNFAPDLDQARFETAARPLFAGRTHLRNIALAPDMVVRMVYPLAGNERALGLDYRVTPGQAGAAERARVSRQIVVAGPLQLVQGGTGLVARLPIYLPGAKGQERFWGLVSAVIDVERLYRSSGLLSENLPLEVAIRGNDGSGPKGEVFFGPAALFDDEPVLTEIRLPQGSWQLAARPRGGWPQQPENVWPLRLGAAAVAVLLFGALGALGRALRAATRAHALAAQANRELSGLLSRYRSLSEDSSDWVWARGADGRHTYINDRGLEILGLEREAFLAGDSLALVHPDDRERLKAALQTGLAARQGWHGLTIRWRRSDGQYRTLESNASPVFDATGQLSGFQGVDRDVTERLAAEEELGRYRHYLEELVAERTRQLAAAKEAAEAANVAKSAFLANMSHEIRTPLNAISGMVHLVRHSGVTAEQAQRLDRLEQASQHLLDVINAILDLSKIEAGKVELARAAVKVDRVVSNVATMLHDRVRAKGLALAIDVQAPPCPLVGDPTRLQQALLNYATNAVKFTDAGQVSLRVRIDAQDDRSALLRFEVEDTGIGIDTETLATLFTPFEQADKTATREHGGTGLGLVITRKLATLMGGDAGVRSAPGQGSVFWFTARLVKGESNAVVAEPARAEPAEQTLRRDHAGRQVLLAEDEPVNSLISQTLLETVGLKVHLAADGAKAVAMARGAAYDLILMDVQMPQLDGLGAARRIRALPGHVHTPIIAITANAFAEDRSECLAAGMNDFVAKPFSPPELYGVLLKWFEAGARP